MRNFSCAKAIFHGCEKLPILPFLAKPEKTALHLCLFSKNFSKNSKFFEELKKRAYNKKIHTKKTILQKSLKKQLFFLKIVLQRSN